MALYTIKEAVSLLDVPRSAILRLIAVGWLLPEQGARGEYRLTFRDLVALRTAKGLREAGLSGRRIGTALRQLRTQLPDELPLSGLRISAKGSEIAVSAGGTEWEAINGQYLLAFDVPGTGAFAPVALPTGAEKDWFSHAYDAEEADLERALEAYKNAVAEEDCGWESFSNYGRLLHQEGLHGEALAVYEAGLRACPHSAILLFNFAVLREDMDEPEDAVVLYQRAIESDPDLEDAHYNLALLHERDGRLAEAIRHFNAYRRLNPAEAVG